MKYHHRTGWHETSACGLADVGLFNFKIWQKPNLILPPINLKQKFLCDFQPAISQTRALKCHLTSNKGGVYAMETQGNSENSFQGQWNF